jgi:nucleotide-binding universal stress UspA family protein
VARRNPFRTEAEAFRLLLYTIAAFAAIAAASILGGWKLGVPVWLAISALAVWYYLRPLPEEALVQARSRSPESDEWRILVVANETLAGRELGDAITAAVAAHPSQVLVVCPALNSKLRHWASDEDAARAAAQERLKDSLARLAEAGVEADGRVGDSDPLQAIEDALRTFGADEIIISTHPEGRSNWLERGVVASARQRFAVPIAHVVVDLGAP